MCPGERPSVAVPTTSSDRDLIFALDRLAGELSYALIQCPSDQIARSMEGTLRLITEVLGVDRSALLECGEDGSAFDVAYFWAHPDVPVELLMDAAAAPWFIGCLLRGETVVLECLPRDLPAHATSERAHVGRTGHKSILAIPVAVANRRTCAMTVISFASFRTWSAPVIERLRFISEILAAAVHRRRQELVLKASRDEVKRLTNLASAETDYVKDESEDHQNFDEIIGDSPALRIALDQVQDVAATDSTVLLLGETGTGKELFARAVHQRSPRRQRALVRVNCAALPASLIESELFGHERGAFTGAVSTRQGRFELADRGTIFLDEIGDLPLEIQAKLLRVLQEGEFERLGSSHTRKVDVRVVAATHRNLEAGVADGTFRADLYYRLSVYPIRLPPLRERPEDIPRLVWFLIHKRKRVLHREITKVSAEAMRALQEYDWPGNVRELENVIERAMIRATGDTLGLDQEQGLHRTHAATADLETLDAVERRHIEEVLLKSDWRINGAGNAAEQLGLHPNTLRFRMKKLKITRPASPSAPIRPEAS
jgi:formate hydrogenlyase transcriptional activator